MNPEQAGLAMYWSC